MPSTLRILMAKNGLIISELNADLRTFGEWKDEEPSHF
jgi:hypothetical protein